MTFGIPGLEQLQKQLEQASKAFKALDGEIASLRFDSADLTSVEGAIAEMEQAINAKIAPYQGNPIIENIAVGMKERFRNKILEQAAEAKQKNEGGPVGNTKFDQSVFRQIESVASDLRRADSNSFERHIRKLSRLLHSPELENFSQQLTDGINLDIWLQAGLATQGGMVGSATLDWPSDPKEEVGTVILLIDRFAKDINEAINFSHTFYYNGSNYTNNLQNMTSQIIIPFVRDYIEFVKTNSDTVEAVMVPVRSGPAARKAFVVHGHDDGPREAVARFLERLGFEAIILHEQANQGRTIIEKIEAHGDVGFAVVLLTPDDVGGVKGGELQPRARQNVMLELGYFIARLGRSRVCALKRGEVEIPSDFGGVIYETYDAGNGWKQALGRELQAAGFKIDWNVVMPS